MVAASRFAASLERDGILNRVGRVRTVLYGSLALTGLGHGTDRATVAGLEGNVPKTVDTDHMSNIRMECEAGGELMLNGTHRIDFDYGRDVVMDVWHRMAAHPNGMRFQAFDRQNNLIDGTGLVFHWRWIRQTRRRRRLMIGIHEKPPAGTAFADQTDDSSTDIDMDMPYPFTTCDELISLCDEHHMSVADVVWANETAMRSAVQVRSDLDTVWHVMRRCVQHGCNTNQTVLLAALTCPAGRQKCMQGSHPTATCSNGTAGAPTLYSNHGRRMGRPVRIGGFRGERGRRTHRHRATNGAAGVIPAVLHYYWHFVDHADEDGVVTFLLTAGAIGYLFKRNASISGAEVGCQGEVGTACSMARRGCAP